MKKVTSVIGAASLFFAGISLAAASGFGAIGGVGGAASGFVGTAGGYAESATVGGSMAQSGVVGTGFSAQFTGNEGSGYASAGGAVDHSGVSTWTNGGSLAGTVSGGYTAGNATGSTAGAVGTDFSSSAWGDFKTGSAGLGVIVGGFGAFGSF